MSRTTKFTIVMLLVALLALAFGAGFELGGRTHGRSSGGLAVVNEVWNIVFTDYVDQSKLDARALGKASIEGMLKELNDPYTSYLDPRDYKLGLSTLEGQFDGIGATVAIKNGQPTIVAPLPDSPAARAGIKPGDVILEVDGKSTSGMSLADTIVRIRGAGGTKVRLLVLHLGEASPVEIEIVRARVEVASVRSEMKGDIAYINISQFTQRTDAELTAVLQNMEAKGIILDLRSNPGGLLETVVDVASHFLTQGIVVSVMNNQKQQTTRAVRSTSINTGLPMVVLTDNFSASGSEVLAGALQDHHRAIIAGAKTFGKGSVDIFRTLSDGSGLYITIARWLTPDGRLIEGEGIEPDYPLQLKGDDAIQWAIDYLKGKR